MITGLVSSIAKKKQAELKLEMEKRLMRHEAELGGKLFPIEDPRVTRREFFCLDENTWVWHEEAKTDNGEESVYTTRYDVRPDRVVKSLNGQGYQALSRDEAKHLLKAVKLYRERVLKKLYPEHNW